MKLSSPTRVLSLTTLALSLFSAAASADVFLDQAQIGWSPGATPYAIGGPLNDEVAQTYTAGTSGLLEKIEFVVSCEDTSLGDIHVEMQTVNSLGEPSGSVLASTSVDSTSLPVFDGVTYGPSPFHPGNIPQVDGTEYAIVIRADAGVTCYSPRGAVAGSMFAYPHGSAYLGDASGGSVSWKESSDPNFDFAFWTYVRVSKPKFCDVTDAVGIPNDWLPADVPACGCLEDPVLNAHRCWFGLPDFVLWREIAPFGDPKAKVNWNLLPLNSGLLEVRAQEFDDQVSGPEVVFDEQLKPGKSLNFKHTAVKFGEVSEVTIEFFGPRGDATVTYEVIQNIQNQQ